MIALTNEQREAIEAQSGEPAQFVDEATQRVYYLVPAATFEQWNALLSDEPFDPAEMYPLIWKAAAAAGWADPEMDIYDHYDEHRPEGATG